MTNEMPKAYEPQKHEDQIYQRWNDSGFFNPDNLSLSEDAPNYTIILPPPNITDKLHMGHASMLAIQDLLIRFHRLRGYRTLWLPGTDHAAIATQNVVEKSLFKETGQTRHDLGKEKFMEKVWAFLKTTQATILNQTKKMGSSLDWSREAFTLDDKRRKAVAKMFVDMYYAGVIYRGERIVNWCPRCKSTLADDEVEYKEQNAKLYTFKYDQNFPITISTTRPETKLGDTAIAVNPKDERYQKYIGQTLEADFVGVPLTIKIIADHNVDQNFGTGALGVTPAHSMVDWQMAENNKLGIIKVIDEDGNIREGFGEYSGKTVKAAREMIVDRLRQDNNLKEEDVMNNLSVCYRCDTSIEPLPSKQWFVNVNKKLDFLGNRSLKEKAIEVAEDKSIVFVPDRFTKRYLDWMNNLHDWCISRQIWFGHEIPVYYCEDCNQIMVSENKVSECNKCGAKNIKQDPDTLDTWFSSGMWTFSTLGWPDTYQNKQKSGDLLKFHPTQVLETGYEIITLWVSRMIMMSLFAVNEVPFETVYLHGMVQDKEGKKMSKSKGNGIDPLDVINKYGTDAVRLSFLIGNTPGNDVRMFEEKIEGHKNFVNKLWNISRYILTKCGDQAKAEAKDYDLSQGFPKSKTYTESDVWIMEKFVNLSAGVKADLGGYNFSPAGEKLRDFTWNDLADWYLEASKFEDNQADKERILMIVLVNLLKLWHPFIPFVTEFIWQEMGNDKLIMVSSWPEVNVPKKAKPSGNFDLVRDIIVAIRNARSENKVEPAKKIQALIYAGKYEKTIASQANIIKSLKTGIETIEVKKKGKAPAEAIYVNVNNIEIYLIGAVDKEKEKARIEKEIQTLEKLIAGAKGRLSNQEFVEKAPKEIIEKEKQTMADREQELDALKEKIA